MFRSGRSGHIEQFPVIAEEDENPSDLVAASSDVDHDSLVARHRATGTEGISTGADDANHVTTPAPSLRVPSLPARSSLHLAAGLENDSDAAEACRIVLEDIDKRLKSLER